MIIGPNERLEKVFLNLRFPVGYCSFLTVPSKEMLYKGGRPGPVVMAEDSCSRGCVFKYRRLILHGYLYIDLL